MVNCLLNDPPPHRSPPNFNVPRHFPPQKWAGMGGNGGKRREMTGNDGKMRELAGNDGDLPGGGPTQIREELGQT